MVAVVDTRQTLNSVVMMVSREWNIPQSEPEMMNMIHDQHKIPTLHHSPPHFLLLTTTVISM